MVRKSVVKRIKMTKTGKLIRRRMAQDHFRAGKSAKKIQWKRKVQYVSKSDAKKIAQYLK